MSNRILTVSSGIRFDSEMSGFDWLTKRTYITYGLPDVNAVEREFEKRVWLSR